VKLKALGYVIYLSFLSFCINAAP